MFGSYHEGQILLYFSSGALGDQSKTLFLILMLLKYLEDLHFTRSGTNDDDCCQVRVLKVSNTFDLKNIHTFTHGVFSPLTALVGFIRSTDDVTTMFVFYTVLLR